MNALNIYLKTLTEAAYIIILVWNKGLEFATQMKSQVFRHVKRDLNVSQYIV